MILTIQPQKVAEISEGMMRMMELDLVEKVAPVMMRMDGAGWGLTVTNAGPIFVFKQDIEDLIQTNEMDFVSNDYHLNSVVPAYGTSRVEPSHDGNYDGAGPSGEGSPSDDGAGWGWT